MMIIQGGFVHFPVDEVPEVAQPTQVRLFLPGCNLPKLVELYSVQLSAAGVLDIKVCKGQYSAVLKDGRTVALELQVGTGFVELVFPAHTEATTEEERKRLHILRCDWRNLA